LGSFPTTIYHSWNSPLKPLINDFVLRMNEGGVYSKIKDHAIFMREELRKERFNERTLDDNEQSRLVDVTNEHLLTGWGFMAFGLLLSFISFAFELCKQLNSRFNF